MAEEIKLDCIYRKEKVEKERRESQTLKVRLFFHLRTQPAHEVERGQERKIQKNISNVVKQEKR